jgi:3-hydroxyanthranilate 3,4-dioxygenase
MEELKAVSLEGISESVRNAVKPVRILWQTPDTIAFVARGRKGRSEFHTDPSDEVMYMIKGVMNLHYLTPEGEEKLLVLREGEIMHCPAGIPHSPRFSPDSFLLVLERKRRPNEVDRFNWYCEECRTPLYQAVRKVPDYDEDPVSRVYEEFYSSEERRTCQQCGHVAQRPA